MAEMCCFQCLPAQDVQCFRSLLSYLRQGHFEPAWMHLLLTYCLHGESIRYDLSLQQQKPSNRPASHHHKLDLFYSFYSPLAMLAKASPREHCKYRYCMCDQKGKQDCRAVAEPCKCPHHKRTLHCNSHWVLKQSTAPYMQMIVLLASVGTNILYCRFSIDTAPRNDHPLR
jgi:hypothetical protein